VPLGFTPDADAVEVVFADGVLKLMITKPAEAKKDVQKISDIQNLVNCGQ